MRVVRDDHLRRLAAACTRCTGCVRVVEEGTHVARPRALLAGVRADA